MNPLDFTGPAFLLFYLVSMVVAMVAQSVLRRLLRSPSSVPVSLGKESFHPYELAYVRGGTWAALDTALATLVAQGRIRVDPNTSNPGMSSLEIVDAAPEHVLVAEGVYRGMAMEESQHPLDLEILRCLQEHGTLYYEELHKEVEPTLERLAPRLVAFELLQPESVQGRRTFLANLLPWLVVALGAAKLVVGVMRNRPVLFLFVLLVLSAFLVTARTKRLPRITRRGERFIEQLRGLNAALCETARSAQALLSARELTLACAVFGYEAMEGDGPLIDLARLQRARVRTTGRAADGVSVGGWSSGCGSSCGSSCGGGCGGGCGGCGS